MGISYHPGQLGFEDLVQYRDYFFLINVCHFDLRYTEQVFHSAPEKRRRQELSELNQTGKFPAKMGCSWLGGAYRASRGGGSAAVVIARGKP